MRKIAISLIWMAMVFSLVGFVRTATAALITFDDYYDDLKDFGVDPGHIAIGDHYQAEYGVTFEQTYAIYWWNQSHVARLYKGDVAAVPLTYDSSIFTFDYVLKSFSLLADAVNDTLYLDAYDSNGNLVKTSSEYLEAGNWYTMSIDLTGVSATKIVLHDNGGSFGFNNMSFEAVPIPSSLLLLGSGLVGLIGIRRKFRKGRSRQ